jgi:hypothetical protein
MLDKDEGHADIGWQRVDKLAAGIKATRRGAYSDNREVPSAAKLAGHHGGAMTRSRPYRFSLTPTSPWHSTVLKVSPPNGIPDLFNATQIALDGILQITRCGAAILYNIAHSQTVTGPRNARSDAHFPLGLHRPEFGGGNCGRTVLEAGA